MFPITSIGNPDARPADAPRNRHRFRAPQAAFALISIAVLLMIFKIASLTPINSDAVQNVLEVTSILHGNILLHGWTLNSDNFYLTDNPFFLIGRLLWGRSAAALYIPPALIYVCLLAASLLIIHSCSRDIASRAIGVGAVLFYLATPGMETLAPIVFVGAQHIAVLTFCLFAWLALQRIQMAAPAALPLGLTVLYACCGFVVFFSDPMGTMMFLPPTLIGLGAAAMRAQRKSIHIIMALFTLVDFIIARFALALLHRAGGFTIAPNYNLQFVSAADFGRNITSELFGLLNLSGAYFFGRRSYRVRTLMTLCRFAGLGLMAAAVVSALRKRSEDDEGWNLRFVLAVAILLDLVSVAVSATFCSAVGPSVLTGGAAIRFLTPAILFGGLLVGLEAPRIISNVSDRPVRIGLITLGGCGVALATSVFLLHGIERWWEKPFVSESPLASVGDWLFHHGLTRGTGFYWNASSITALSGQRVKIRAVLAQNGRLVPYNWLSDARWYTPVHKPQFVIFNKTRAFGITPRTIAATYGSPFAVIEKDGYDIAIFGSNPQKKSK